MGWYHNKDAPVPLSSSGSLLLSEQEAFIVTNPSPRAAKRALYRPRSNQERDFSVQHKGPKSV